MVENRQFTLRKNERLSGKTRIENVFSSGGAFLSYPFRVVYCVYEKNEDHCQPSVLISIPKKRLKRAVDRNKIKRITKEVYRLNKSFLYLENISERLQVDIALIYVSDDVQPYKIIEKGIVKSLNKISKRLNKGIMI